MAKGDGTKDTFCARTYDNWRADLAPQIKDKKALKVV
jgi:hypothetical protein